MRLLLTTLAALLSTLCHVQAQTRPAQHIVGAGSSAAAPIYRNWASAYERATGVVVAYEAVGSSRGIQEIRRDAVSFGASDVALSAQESEELGLLTFPVAITGIAPVYNLPQVGDGQLRLTGDVLSRIFLGEITRWNAPEIAALNPDVPLPDAAIRVIVRADGSGTTYNFSDYLGKVSPAWKAVHAPRTHLNWPQHFIGVQRSSGVAQAVRQTPYAIAYVDHGYVREHGLKAAMLQNAQGEFVYPSVEAFRLALMHSSWASSGTYTETLTQMPGKGAWPITMGTFILLPKVARDPQRTQAAMRFFTWAFLNGDMLVQQSHFVRLPNRVQAAAFKTMTLVRDNAGRPMEIMTLPCDWGGCPAGAEARRQATFSTATSVRPTARPEPFRVCTSSFLPLAFLKRACRRRAWKSSQLETELISRYFC